MEKEHIHNWHLIKKENTGCFNPSYECTFVCDCGATKKVGYK